MKSALYLPTAKIVPMILKRLMVGSEGLEPPQKLCKRVICVNCALAERHSYLCNSPLCPLSAPEAIPQICIDLRGRSAYKGTSSFMYCMKHFLSCLGFHRIFALAPFGAKGDTHENRTSTAGSFRRSPSRLRRHSSRAHRSRRRTEQSSGFYAPLPTLRVGN